MDPQADRIELKWLVDSARPTLPVERLLHPDLRGRLCPLGIYSVYSLYFDTHHLTSYWDHRNGMLHRFKVRLRWYGEGEGGGLFLERKIRAGDTTRKERRRVEERLKEAPYFDLVRELLAFPEMRGFDGVPLPVLLVRYRRERYAVHGKTWQCTIDSGIGFNDQRFGTRLDTGVPPARSDVTVAELKIPRAEAEREAGGATLRTRGEQFSKYLHGMRRCIAS